MRETKRLLPAARHEPTDIGSGFIWGAVALILATLLGCALLVRWLYPIARLDRTLQLPLPLYPEPRLQADPAQDLRRLNSEQMHRLNSAGWLDRERDVAHIPITQAMQDVARDGIAEWPPPGEQAP